MERLGGQTGDRQKIVRSKRTGLLNVIIERGAAVEMLQLEKRPLLMDWIGETAIQQSNDPRVTQAFEDLGFAKNVGDVAVDSLVLEGLDYDLSPGVTVPAQKRDPEASCSQDAQNLLPMDGKGRSLYPKGLRRRWPYRKPLRPFGYRLLNEAASRWADCLPPMEIGRRDRLPVDPRGMVSGGSGIASLS